MEGPVASGLVYVAECSGDQIKLVCKSASYSRELGKLGYTLEPLLSFYADIFPDVAGYYYIKTCKDDKSKCHEMEVLREARIPFADGKVWSPYELVELFRERGLLQGTFLKISWLDTKRFEIESF